MDISAMELMELVLAAIVLSLVQSLCFYEKGKIAAAGEGQLHVSSKDWRAAEMGGNDYNMTHLLPWCIYDELMWLPW